MGGCDMPVVINSGSGNQGIACSVPLIVYAREMEPRTIVCTGRLYFPIFLLCIRNIILATIGILWCGVCILCGRSDPSPYGRGKYFPDQKDYRKYSGEHSGIICDGAKISCAAKIAASLDAAFLAHHLAMNGQSYAPYTGILQEETAETISCVGQIGKDGMKRNRPRNP